MIIIIGLVILVAALIVGAAGVLGNGSSHPLTHGFAVLGYHVTGSAGTLFLTGIMVGAAGLLGLALLLAGARRTARRGREARLGLRQSRLETAAVTEARDSLIDEREAARAYTASTLGTDPAAADSGGEPDDVESADVQPGKIEPGKIEPGKIEPGEIAPVNTQRRMNKLARRFADWQAANRPPASMSGTAVPAVAPAPAAVDTPVSAPAQARVPTDAVPAQAASPADPETIPDDVLGPDDAIIPAKAPALAAAAGNGTKS